MNALIGTGFYCTHADSIEKRQQLFRWLLNTTASSIVVVDNSERNDGTWMPAIACQSIRVNHNLGHVGAWLPRPTEAPQLLGWSLSWILPALVAYSERKDFVYIEQDCLAFGNWQTSIMADVEAKDLNVAIGRCPANIAACEQSLFWVRWQTIPLFVAAYLAIPESDAVMLPEEKFVKLMNDRPDLKIGFHDLPGGRARPLPYDAPAWYAQHITPEEMAELKRRGLL